jgi:WD repeat-containing protein 44
MIRCILGSQCACGSVFCWPLLHIPSLLFPLQPLKLHPKFSFAFSLSLSREPRWNGLGTVQHQEHGGGGSGVEMSRGGDRDAFFHCLDRVPSGLHIDADFPSDEDDDDVRLSFASAMGDQSAQSFRRYQAAVLEEEDEEEWEAEDPSMYDMWMSDDMSIQERRRHLHQGLGMASSRDLALRRHSMKKRPADIVPRSVSRRLPPPSPTPVTATSPEAPPPSATATPAAPVAAGALQPARAITRRHSDTSLAVRDGGDAGKPALALRRVRSLPARHAACDSARAEEKAQQAVTARELPASSVDKCCEEGRGDDMQGSGGKEVAAVAAAQQQSGVPGWRRSRSSSATPPS